MSPTRSRENGSTALADRSARSDRAAVAPSVLAGNVFPLRTQVLQEGFEAIGLAQRGEIRIVLEQRVAREAVVRCALYPALRPIEVADLRIDSADRIRGVVEVDESFALGRFLD